MRSMLKALGFIKSKAPTEELLAEHTKQLQLHEAWTTNVANIARITQELSKSYGRHKGDFALGRYEELKGMIKDAVAQCKELKSVASGAGVAKQHSVSKLHESARAFAELNSTKNEKKMSAKEMKRSCEEMKKEILVLKDTWFTTKKRYEELEKQYENSKKYSPVQRYQVLKELIKETII